MSNGLLLVLDRREVEVRVENRALRVQEPDGGFRRFPPRILEAVTIHGAPMVRCDVWRLLAEHRVPAVVLPHRGQGEPAWLGSGLSATVGSRRAQYAAAASPEHRLELARASVAAKLDSTIAAARHLGEPAVEEATQRHRIYLDHVSDRDSLLGIEGSAARAWYDALAHRIPAHWEFSGRNRRPPRDPVNALFSLGHTLLATQALGRVEAAGLDPWQGFLHVPVSGRPALALDAMESLRPWVELFALGLLDTALAPDDFRCSQAEGCRLEKEARGRFYAAWSEWSRAIPADGPGHGTGLRTLLTRRVRDIRRHLLSTGPEAAATTPEDSTPDAPY